MKLLVLTACLFISQNSLAKEESHKKFFNSTEIDQLMTENNIPGIALAKIKDSSINFLEVYGYANIDSNIRVSTQTMFNVASISKPIMGLTLLQLVDKQKLSLDDNINKYLPFKVDNPHFDDEIITLRNLATHSSSIADYYEPSSFSKNVDSPVSLEQHIRSLLVKGSSAYKEGAYYLNYRPGTNRDYSNLAAGVAGLLVESVTGESLSFYSQKTLFSSLDMKHTSWLLAGLDFSNVAIPYSISDDGNFLANPHIGNPQYPDGGIRSSIEDMAKLMVGLLNNQNTDGEALLSRSSYSEMLSLQMPSDISKQQRFFWSDNSMGLTGHMGSDIGTFCAFYFEPSSGDGFIILMNVDMNEDSVNAMRTLAQRLFSDED